MVKTIQDECKFFDHKFVSMISQSFTLSGLKLKKQLPEPEIITFEFKTKYLYFSLLKIDQKYYHNF